jgi:hypothetical protein
VPRPEWVPAVGERVYDTARDRAAFVLAHLQGPDCTPLVLLKPFPDGAAYTCALAVVQQLAEHPPAA